MSNGQITPKEDRLTVFKRSILSEKAIDAITNALPEHLNPQKMARVVITAVTRTPKLLECNPMTVMNAVIEASQLGLMPDSVLGHGYLVPYGKTCVFIPGYKGMLDLARRSGELAWVQARVVYANDVFTYGYGMEPTLEHTPARALGKEPGEMTAAYGIAKYKTGEFHFEVMHKDEIEAIRRRSRAGNDGPWITDYDEMARKTVIRRLCKFLPMNPEYQNLVARDEYHEAGVLGQYIDVDPKTGEVLGQREEPTSRDMLDLFADQLEGEEEGDEIQDPRFEESEPEPKPAAADAGENGDGGSDEGGEGGEPDAPAEDGPGDQAGEQEDGEGDADSKGDGEEPLLEQGSGRISKAEDTAFIAAVEKLKERMLAQQDAELVQRVINNRLKMVGARDVLEIRTRLDREKFYRECHQMCEQWESLPKPKDE